MLNVGQILGIVAGSLAGVIILEEIGVGFCLGASITSVARVTVSLAEWVSGKSFEVRWGKVSPAMWESAWGESPFLTIIGFPFFIGESLGALAGAYAEE